MVRIKTSGSARVCGGRSFACVEGCNKCTGLPGNATGLGALSELGFIILERAPFCNFSFQAENGIRDATVTGVQTCALPIFEREREELAQVDEREERRVEA